MTTPLPPVSAPDLDLAVALFGQAINTNPKALGLINTFGPLLFASLLFSMSQDWAPDPADPDQYIPRRSNPDARDQAIRIINAVYDGIELTLDGGPDTELLNT